MHQLLITHNSCARLVVTATHLNETCRLISFSKRWLPFSVAFRRIIFPVPERFDRSCSNKPILNRSFSAFDTGHLGQTVAPTDETVISDSLERDRLPKSSICTRASPPTKYTHYYYVPGCTYVCTCYAVFLLYRHV